MPVKLRHESSAFLSDCLRFSLLNFSNRLKHISCDFSQHFLSLLLSEYFQPSTESDRSAAVHAREISLIEFIKEFVDSKQKKIL